MDQNHNILDVAEWFLQQQPMSHKKLQKICYYAVAWSYALFGVSLFSDSSFQAWANGPVSRTLYDKFHGHGWDDLQPEQRSLELSAQEENLLNRVLDTYGEDSANGLEALSHSELPWVSARVGVSTGASSENVIDPRVMEAYYKSIYIGDNENGEDQV